MKNPLVGDRESLRALSKGAITIGWLPDSDSLRMLSNMTVDRDPRKYVYVSRRLCQEMIAQDDAAGSGASAKFAVGVPGVSAEISRRDRHDNIYWLAREATRVVADHTGTLLCPGAYVRAVMDVKYGVLEFFRGGYEVAWLHCDDLVGEDRFLVELCGSVGNYLGSSPDKDPSLRWHPSDAMGLTWLVQHFSGGREEADQAVAAGRENDRGTALSYALDFVRHSGPGNILGQGRLEVLFQVFQCSPHWEERGTRYRVAYIGTPIWAATPLPGRDPLL